MGHFIMEHFFTIVSGGCAAWLGTFGLFHSMAHDSLSTIAYILCVGFVGVISAIFNSTFIHQCACKPQKPEKTEGK